MPTLNLKPTHKPIQEYYAALDWVIDQYQVKTDGRSGISNDPNNPDDETYILRLIKQVITVSLETVEIVNNLPALDLLIKETP